MTQTLNPLAQKIQAVVALSSISALNGDLIADLADTPTGDRNPGVWSPGGIDPFVALGLPGLFDPVNWSDSLSDAIPSGFVFANPPGASSKASGGVSLSSLGTSVIGIFGALQTDLAPLTNVPVLALLRTTAVDASPDYNITPWPILLTGPMALAIAQLAAEKWKPFQCLKADATFTSGAGAIAAGSADVPNSVGTLEMATPAGGTVTCFVPERV